jgi:hypothetical protein
MKKFSAALKSAAQIADVTAAVKGSALARVGL